jgi:hypothetical protein
MEHSCGLACLAHGNPIIKEPNEMADRETIIDTGGGDGGSGILIAIAVLVVVAIAAYFLFFNRPVGSPAGSTVTIEAPDITVPAPATPAPAAPAPAN